MSDLSRPPAFTERYTLNVTEDMDKRLKQVLDAKPRDVKMNDLLREAIRYYLDEQEDLVGSKRHFSKSLQNRIDQLEGKLLFYLNILIYMVAAGLAVIIQAVTKDSKVQSTNLIRTAIAAALKEGPTLNQQIQAVRDELGEGNQ